MYGVLFTRMESDSGKPPILRHVDISVPIFMPKYSAKRYGLKKYSSVRHFIEPNPAIEAGLRFTEHHRFCSIRDALMGRVNWTETELHSKALARIESGRTAWQLKTVDQLLARYKSIERLFRDIEVNGYMSQTQLKVRRREGGVVETSSGIRKLHEVKLGLNHQGQMIFLDGAHRLTICILLKIEVIPALIFFE